jgi:hypothetical protein
MLGGGHPGRSSSCRSHLRRGPPPPFEPLGPSAGQVVAARCRSARSIHSRLRAWVAASTTGGAPPASWACAPPARAQTPAVARSQPREAELRAWSHQVVAHLRAEPQELLSDQRADRVHPGVLAPGVTAAVTVEARHRVGAAALQLATQHVARHRRIVPSATDTSSATGRGSKVCTRSHATRSPDRPGRLSGRSSPEPHSPWRSTSTSSPTRPRGWGPSARRRRAHRSAAARRARGNSAPAGGRAHLRLAHCAPPAGPGLRTRPGRVRGHDPLGRDQHHHPPHRPRKSRTRQQRRTFPTPG